MRKLDTLLIIFKEMDRADLSNEIAIPYFAALFFLTVRLGTIGKEAAS